MNWTSKITRPLLIHAVLASTLFGIPTTTHAVLTPLDALANNQNSGISPYNTPQNGYIFTAPNVTFTILANTNVGADNTSTSVSNLNPAANTGNILVFQGQSTVTGAVGALPVTSPICTLQLAGSAAQPVTFMGSIYGAPITLSNGGGVILADGLTVSEGVTNTSANNLGSIAFQGGGTISGDLGNTFSLNQITANSLAGTAKTVNLNGSVIQATTLFLNDDATHPTTLSLNGAATQTVNGSFTVNTNGLDFLNLLAATSTNLTGNIGSAGKAFATVSLGNGNTGINGNIYTNTLNYNGNGNLTLAPGGVISSQNIVGAGTGQLIFSGGGAVIGTITGPRTILLQGGASTNVNFQNNITGTLNFDVGSTPTSIASFNSGVTINGNINNTSGAAGNGLLTFLGGGQVTGSIGSALFPIAGINLAGPGTVELAPNIYLANSLAFAPGSNLTTKAQLDDGTTLTGSVINNTGAGIGILDFAGGGTITGDIGNPLAIQSLIVNSNAFPARMVTLDGPIINIQNITTGTVSTDTLVLPQNTVTSNNIGSSANPFFAINVAGSGNTTINASNIYANSTVFQANNQLILGPGITVYGSIGAIANSQGTLIFTGNGTVTDAIGAVNTLNEIQLQGGAGSVVSLQKNTSAGSINFVPNAVATSTLQIGSNAVITSNINNLTTADNVGTLAFKGSSSVSGTVGATHSLFAINLQGGSGSAVTFTQNVHVGAGDLNFAPGSGANSQVILADGLTLTGAVDNTTATPYIGQLILQGGGVVTGDIGDSQPLSLININTNHLATRTVELDASVINAQNLLSANVNQDTLILGRTQNTTINTSIGNSPNIFQLLQVAQGGNVSLNGDIFATTTLFEGNHQLILSNGRTINGAVDANVPNIGFLVFSGGGTVTGTIGLANRLNAVELLGLGTVNFQNSVLNHTPIQLFADATVNLSDGVNVFDVDNLTEATAGTLIFQGAGFAYNIGATAPLSLVTLNANGGMNTVTFDGTTENASLFAIHDDGMNATTLQLNNLNLALTGNITAQTPHLDVLDIHQAATLTGDIGTSSNPLALVNVGAITNTLIEGNVYTDTLQFQGNQILTLADNSNIVGSVITTNNNQGILNYAGTSLISSQIGMAGASLNALNINGGVGTAVTLNNDLFATNTNIHNGATFVVSGTQTLTGTLTVFNGGTLSLESTARPMTEVGNFNLNNGGTLNIDFGGQLLPGSVVSTQIATIDTGAKLTLSNIPRSVADGVTRIPIVTGQAGSVINVIAASSNSLLLTFTTVADNVNHQLDLIMNSRPVTQFAFQSNTKGIAGALDYLVNLSQNGNTPFKGVLGESLDELDSFTDAASLNQALAEFAPTVDGGVLEFSYDAPQLAFDVITSQLNNLLIHKIRPLGLTRQRQAGFNAGGVNDIGRGLWFKLFGGYLHQNMEDDIQGYKGKLWGWIAGADWLLNDFTSTGLAISWSTANVHNAISSGSQTDIDNYQVALYGQFVAPCQPFYVNWFGSIGYNDYDAFREVTFGSLFFTPESLYHAWQYSAKTEVGFLYNRFTPLHLMPIASLYYSYLNFEDYTESGAGTANQIVYPENATRLQGGLGLKWVYDCIYDTVLLQPELRFVFLYDFINDNMQTASQFVGGGPSFITTGFTPAKTSYDVGVSLTSFENTTGVNATLSYDFNYRQGYTAHAGWAKIRYEW